MPRISDKWLFDTAIDFCGLEQIIFLHILNQLFLSFFWYIHASASCLHLEHLSASTLVFSLPHLLIQLMSSAWEPLLTGVKEGRITL